MGVKARGLLGRTGERGQARVFILAKQPPPRYSGAASRRLPFQPTPKHVFHPILVVAHELGTELGWGDDRSSAKARSAAAPAMRIIDPMARSIVDQGEEWLAERLASA